jgi:probable rRNA maturation factor
MESEPLILFSSLAKGLDRRWLREFAERLSREMAEGKQFTALLTSDRQLRTLNRDFLGKDSPTDVLSFPAEGAGEWLGDIAISIQRAREQAAEHGHGLEQEIAVLLLHGVLHLLGHDHDADRGRMRRLESNWRKKLGLSAGLIERAAPK